MGPLAPQSRPPDHCDQLSPESTSINSDPQIGHNKYTQRKPEAWKKWESWTSAERESAVDDSVSQAVRLFVAAEDTPIWCSETHVQSSWLSLAHQQQSLEWEWQKTIHNVAHSNQCRLVLLNNAIWSNRNTCCYFTTYGLKCYSCQECIIITCSDATDQKFVNKDNEMNCTSAFTESVPVQHTSGINRGKFGKFALINASELNHFWIAILHISIWTYGKKTATTIILSTMILVKSPHKIIWSTGNIINHLQLTYM